jgi:DNA polymerase III delta' subunit
VTGQEVARGYFTRALASGRVSHAYLLVGPEGVGKRRFAEELAAAFLCRRGDPGACGECVSCRTLRSENHPCLIRLAPESGGTIDINLIRDTVAQLALRVGDRRIVVLDDAAGLSTEAANALLKTLEEPPPGVVFLLVTSRPAHLIDTIHSRCHRVPFTTLTASEFDTVLEVSDHEPGAVPALFAASGGSPGRAHRILDGVGECGGNDRVEDLLAGRGFTRPESLIDYVPPRGKETKKERVRRLLEVLLDLSWGRRLEGERARRSALAAGLSELLFDLDTNQNPELILERTAVLLGR